jgi:pyruvate dehydrogenase E1 component alpha subunit
MIYPPKLLKELYQTMVRIRLCEESFVGPILKEEVQCPVHLYSGEEAVAAGVCAVLKEEDYIFGTHRSHGHYLAKGGSMPELVAEIYGKETGCSRGRGGSMHIIAPEKGMLGAAPIVGGTISLAVGAALASSIRKDQRITVSFFGDGAVGEGVFYESLNFAAIHNLPIIFACENNLYSTHLSIEECRVSNNIFEIGSHFSMENSRIDGNNVLEVYEAAQKAADKCREGKGPVLLEFMTYRLRGHVGPCDSIQGGRTDIRPKEEIEKWRGKDPIKIFERFLLENKILTEEILMEIMQHAEKEVVDSHNFAKTSPYPLRSELKDYVFSEKEIPVLSEDEITGKETLIKNVQRDESEVEAEIDNSYVFAKNSQYLKRKEFKENNDNEEKTPI